MSVHFLCLLCIPWTKEYALLKIRFFCSKCQPCLLSKYLIFQCNQYKLFSAAYFKSHFAYHSLFWYAGLTVKLSWYTFFLFKLLPYQFVSQWFSFIALLTKFFTNPTPLSFVFWKSTTTPFISTYKNSRFFKSNWLSVMKVCKTA